MATKVFTTDLKVGMFVADLDRPWVDTPFLLQGFLIEDQEQIAALQTHCEYVVVDRSRSVGDQYEAGPGMARPGANAPPAARPAAPQSQRPAGASSSAVDTPDAPRQAASRP